MSKEQVIKIKCLDDKAYLGDYPANSKDSFTTPPCRLCGTQWQVKQITDGLLDYRRVDKAEVKEYRDALAVEGV